MRNKKKKVKYSLTRSIRINTIKFISLRDFDDHSPQHHWLWCQQESILEAECEIHMPNHRFNEWMNGWIRVVAAAAAAANPMREKHTRNLFNQLIYFYLFHKYHRPMMNAKYMFKNERKNKSTSTATTDDVIVNYDAYTIHMILRVYSVWN